jgi:hypothetical protein
VKVVVVVELVSMVLIPCENALVVDCPPLGLVAELKSPVVVVSSDLTEVSKIVLICESSSVDVIGADIVARYTEHDEAGRGRVGQIEEIQRAVILLAYTARRRIFPA